VTWEDGWPVVNGSDLVESEMSVDDTDLEAAGDRGWTRTVDPFADAADTVDLGPEWNYWRNPDRERYRSRGRPRARRRTGHARRLPRDVRRPTPATPRRSRHVPALFRPGTGRGGGA